MFRKKKPTTDRRRHLIIQELLSFGTLPIHSVLSKLNSSHAGLLSTEADTRLEECSEPLSSSDVSLSLFLQFFLAFLNPFNAILIGLSIVSYITDVFLQPEHPDFSKTIILLLMVIVSSFIRFIQEFRSQKAVLSLKKMVHNSSLVLRQYPIQADELEKEPPLSLIGKKSEIPVSELVPGDIVYLSAGDIIPADMRLIESIDLFITESALTGESMPVEKFSQAPDSTTLTHSPLLLQSLVFMGTSVISGSGVGVVLATGKNTYFGSLTEKLSEPAAATSFDKGLNRVSFILISFMLCMIVLIFGINFYTKSDFLSSLLFSLSVAVSLTPEMLPLIISSNLAKGAVKLSSQKVIVKKLSALQNFGAMTVLCTDKTGTLTENRVVLVRHMDINGLDDDRVLDFAYLNSYFQTGLRNLMDSSIIEHIEKNERTFVSKNYHKIDEIPFSFSRRRMSIIVQKEDGSHLMICKGAVEEVEKLCSHIDISGTVLPADPELLRQTKILTKKNNQDGLRVLAVAYKHFPASQTVYKSPDETDLVLVGFVGFLDPPKASAKTAISSLNQHGVQVKIITGDNSIVTGCVASEVGIETPSILRGDELDHLSHDELLAQVDSVNIFTKVDPLQKARIVQALQEKGHTVGFLGDGVNDAAALKVSDVGISVDNAVDIARETADIILLENDLMVLENGLLEGRSIFGNIMKYIKMTASSNFGNALSLLIASLFLPFLPMLPLHLLIQNLLYDFSQLGLAFDKMDADFLQKPRQWNADGIVRFMICIGPISTLFDLLCFFILWSVFSFNTVSEAPFFQCGWFMLGLLSQLLIVHLIRTPKLPFFESMASKPVLILGLFFASIGLLLPFTAFGSSIGFQVPPYSYFFFVFLLLTSYFILMQWVKTRFILFFKEWI